MKNRLYFFYFPLCVSILGVSIVSVGGSFGWYKAGKDVGFTLENHSQLLVIAGAALMLSGSIFSFIDSRISKIEEILKKSDVR